jgi:hypothetical protein
MPDTTARLASLSPLSSSGANSGGGASAPWPPRNASTRRTSRGSRSERLAWPMRPLRVSRLNANCSGGSPQWRGTSSKYSALRRAASWKRSTTGRRSSS